MQRSVSHGRTVKSAFLVILMIIMTQVGYLDLINSPRTGNDSFNDDSSVMETGGSGSAIVYANNIWDSSTTASSGSSGGMANVTGATCTVSPALPTGLNIDSSTCTISGTPSVATTNTTYTITAIISGTTFQTSVWLSSET